MSRDLRPLFDPRSVAVVGASADPAKWGNVLARGALRGAHRRPVYLVNRDGRRDSRASGAHRSLGELPDAPELVVLSVPAAGFEAAVDEALAAGAKAIVGISAGLGELDEAGREVEAAVAERVRSAGAVLLGPNCLGVFDARCGARPRLECASRGRDRADFAERQSRARARPPRRRGPGSDSPASRRSATRPISWRPSSSTSSRLTSARG